MKPAPPVIMIFLTSGRGVYFVLPVRIGASFQTPKSSKNLLVSALPCAGASYDFCASKSQMGQCLLETPLDAMMMGLVECQ